MQFYTTDNLPANLAQRSFTANLMRLQPNGSAPLLALSGMAQERKMAAVAHSYWVKRALFPQLTVNGAQADSITNVVVDDSSNAIVGRQYLAFNVTAGTWGTPELMRVSAVPDATHVTFVRGIAGTTAIALADNAVLLEVGSAYEEGSNKPTARSITQDEHTNFAQTFRDLWSVSGTLGAIDIETNTTIKAENQEDAMWLHAENMEMAMIFGRKGTGTLNSKPIRYMDGIESIVTQFAPGNVVAAGATTTFAQLESFLHPTLDTVVKGRKTNNKALYCGAQAVEVINEIGRASGYFQLQEDNTSFGTKFHTFKTSRGTFDVIEHPLFADNPTTRRMALIADPLSLELLWLRKTFHKDIAFDGTDATEGVYTSELSLELNNPMGWGLIYNLTAGA